jgi:hypothetical protein
MKLKIDIPLWSRHKTVIRLNHEARARIMAKGSDFAHYDDRLLRMATAVRGLFQVGAALGWATVVWCLPALNLVAVDHDMLMAGGWSEMGVYTASFLAFAMFAARASVALRILAVAPFTHYDWVSLEFQQGQFDQLSRAAYKGR